MRLVSFDVFRAMGIPDVRHLKPEHYCRDPETVRAADRVLYPEYWQLNSLRYGLRKRTFPSPASYHLGHDKIEQPLALLTVGPQLSP